MRGGQGSQAMALSETIQSVKRRVPKRYPAIGFAILGVYLVATLVVAPLRFLAAMEDVFEEFRPENGLEVDDEGVEGIEDEHARQQEALRQELLRRGIKPEQLEGFGPKRGGAVIINGSAGATDTPEPEEETEEEGTEGEGE